MAIFIQKSGLNFAALVCLNSAPLNNRQTDSVDLLIDVERIDVGHAADVINYRHDALLQILVLYIILAAYPAQELLE